jgi:hypothetical protein
MYGKEIPLEEQINCSLFNDRLIGTFGLFRQMDIDNGQPQAKP